MSAKTDRSRASALACYLLYGVAATVFFVCWNFPLDRLEQWAVAKIARATSLRVEPHERHMRFPLLLQWGRVGLVGMQGATDHVLQGEHLSVDLAVLPLLKRTVSAAVQVRLLAGDVAGVVEWQGGGRPLEYRVQGRARDLELARLESSVIAAGRLQCDWDYHWDSGHPLQGRGLLTVDLQGVTLGGGLFGGTTIPPMTFQTISGRIALNRGVGTVEDFRAESPEAVILGGGSVVLQQPLEESLLNLSLQVRFQGGSPSGGDTARPRSFAGGLYRLVVKGTARRPAVILNDVPVTVPETGGPIGKV